MNGNPSITQYVTAKTWHERHRSHGGEVFPTLSSLSWFLRTHKDVLTAEGVLIVGTGSRPNLLAKDFDSRAAKLLAQSQMT
jgi:hypothetical protein